PAAVYDNLSKLTAPSYVHKPFVDGTPSAGDAYIGGAWKSVLLGSLGGGGKAIFALDITTPTAMGAGQVMWEFKDANDLGHTVGQAQIARLNNGVWAAIFANGYNSTSDRAYLYLVNLQTGALIKKIPAGVSTSNGLSTPVLYDSDGDKTVDAVYAGDAQGNMWKFDLTGSNVTTWAVANSGQPLFTARNASNQVQPITSQPRIGAHSSGGVLVHFGTGQYLTAADTSSAEVQSYYAIWDNGSPVTTTDRSELQAQTIVAETIEFGKSVRETSANTVDWAGGKRGWYLDLLPPLGSGGERITVRPLLIYDRVLFVTRKPSTDQCVPGGESWIMQLDAEAGARYATSVFDLNNDNAFTADDNLASGHVASGIKTTVGIASTPVFLTGTGGGYGGASGEVGALGTPVSSSTTTPPSNPSPDYGIVSGTSGNTETFKIAPSPDPCLGASPPPSCTGGGGGGGGIPIRVYWQQIL
ncbi:MAG TPA: PilC/PilY family type IV pilus protein, partial [Halomonas sp.]|nr:PilC/PilY family type IV pilus protein [Halomonas sp.]